MASDFGALEIIEIKIWYSANFLSHFLQSSDKIYISDLLYSFFLKKMTSEVFTLIWFAQNYIPWILNNLYFYQTGQRHFIYNFYGLSWKLQPA